MEWKKFLMQGTVYLIGFLYDILFIGYLLWINFFRSSFNIISVPAIVLPFALFLLYRWSAWKNKYSKAKAKGKRTFVFITILGAILPLYCLVLLGINEYKYHFTVEKWKNKPDERVYMVDDLLKQHDLKGKTKEEIGKLLGESTENGYFKEPHTTVYWLGIERGFVPIDSEWLVIWFNSSGKVAKYKILKD